MANDHPARLVHLFQGFPVGLRHLLALAQDDGERRSELVRDVGEEAVAHADELFLHVVVAQSGLGHVPEHDQHQHQRDEGDAEHDGDGAFVGQLGVGHGHVFLVLPPRQLLLQRFDFKHVVAVEHLLPRLVGLGVAVERLLVVPQVAVVVGIEEEDFRQKLLGAHFPGRLQRHVEILPRLGVVLHGHPDACHGDAGLHP